MNIRGFKFYLTKPTTPLRMLIHTIPNLSKLPGGWVPNANLVPDLTSGPIHSLTNLSMGHGFQRKGEAFVIENVFNHEDTQNLRNLFASAPVKAPVSVTGFMDGNEHAAYGGVAGSTRTTIWSEKLAAQVWKLIQSDFKPRVFFSNDSTDWWQNGEHHQWIPVGVSPMMRFMRYEQGGEHYAHYDAGYFYPDGEHRTLQSVVIYLTTNDSGATRLIEDEQYRLPIQERKFSDWTEQVPDDKALHKIYPKEGSMLVFDHRLAHDVQPYVGTTPRIIIRTDIIFKKA